MFGMSESDSRIGCLLAQIMIAFCLAMVEWNKAAWEVELWKADPALSYTGVAIRTHNLATTVLDVTTPLVATFSYNRKFHHVSNQAARWLAHDLSVSASP